MSLSLQTFSLIFLSLLIDLYKFLLPIWQSSRQEPLLKHLFYCLGISFAYSLSSLIFFFSYITAVLPLLQCNDHNQRDGVRARRGTEQEDCQVQSRQVVFRQFSSAGSGMILTGSGSNLLGRPYLIRFQANTPESTDSETLRLRKQQQKGKRYVTAK